MDNADYIRLSNLFTDPRLRSTFDRIERDASGALVLPKRPDPVLAGGATVMPEPKSVSRPSAV